jgi:DNA repair protein RadC
MGAAGQLDKDIKKLATLISGFTGIPAQRLESCISSHGAKSVPGNALALCQTQRQREKLQSLFAFKALYEAIRAGEGHNYTIDSAQLAKEFFRELLQDSRDKEYVYALFLNSRHRVIKTLCLSEGTVNQTTLYPRELVKEALFCNASSVILAHNHPSGSLKPSRADLDLTARCLDALAAVSIQLNDHVIVGGCDVVSFVESGYFDQARGLSKARGSGNTPADAAANKGSLFADEEGAADRQRTPGAEDNATESFEEDEWEQEL